MHHSIRVSFSTHPPTRCTLCSAVELHRSQLPPELTQLHLQGFRDLTSSMRHTLPRQASGAAHAARGVVSILPAARWSARASGSWSERRDGWLP